MLNRRLSCESRRILPATIVFAVVGGCSTGAPLNVDISDPPSPVMELSWAKVKRTSEGIAVLGQVRQVHCCGYVRGHIHIEAVDKNGLELAATNVQWGEFNPRQLHSAWFKAALHVPGDRTVSAIKIQFSTESRRGYFRRPRP